MPRDERAAEVAAWLSRAGDDIRAANLDLAADPPLLTDAAFHCQQAVEKSLKGLLSHHEHPFRKTHDIGELALACLEHEPSMEALFRESASLTEYAWRFRYPGDVLEPELEEVQGALRVATQVVEAVTAAVGQ
jgi:HEPN domain-containing protein